MNVLWPIIGSFVGMLIMYLLVGALYILGLEFAVISPQPRDEVTPFSVAVVAFLILGAAIGFWVGLQL